jgi:hypothetical protein
MDLHTAELDTEDPKDLVLGPVDGPEDIHDKELDRRRDHPQYHVRRVKENKLLAGVRKRLKCSASTTCHDDETESDTETETVPES